MSYLKQVLSLTIYFAHVVIGDSDWSSPLVMFPGAMTPAPRFAAEILELQEIVPQWNDED
jgi:hypothetical protein